MTCLRAMFCLRKLALAASLALVPCLAAASGLAPIASPDPQAMREARERFVQMADEARRHGSLPRLSDADARPVLQAIWDNRIVAPGRVFDRQQALALVPLCEGGGRTVYEYVTFRTRGPDAPVTGSNFGVFQAEIAMGMDFTLRCSIAMLDGGAAYVRALPPERMTDSVRVDLDELRRHVTASIVGALGIIRERRMQPGSVTRIAVALRESAPRLVVSLPAADRADIALFARDALPHAGALARADLEAFIRALGGP